MRSVLLYAVFPVAALAAGCASTPPPASMTLTPEACVACGGGVPEYSYGTPYTDYPVIAVPIYPVIVPPPPVQKPPLPPALPPPPPKPQPRPLPEKPCPRSEKACP